jgi:hypothetical protein
MLCVVCFLLSAPALASVQTATRLKAAAVNDAAAAFTGPLRQPWSTVVAYLRRKLGGTLL